MRTGLASALAFACALIAAVPASADVRVGPKGKAFYTPPAPLPGKKHGDIVWARELPAGDGVKAAASDTLILYRSTAVGGDPVAVSGTVMTPRAKAPKGGWPVVSFAHGTTGIADQCAPSRFPVLQGGYGKQQIGPLYSGYLKAGYAVVQTDYEGLGTPGVHPYLVDHAAARSVLDVVRAGRRLDPRIGKRVLLAGHSQGGHAALWAAGDSRKWTPDLKVTGTQAFAPLSHASTLVAAARALTDKGGLAPEAGMFLRALDTTFPDFGIQGYMSDRALELYPQTLTKCLDKLFDKDSFGGISVAEMIREGVDLQPLVDLTVQYVDFNELKLPGGVLLLQGTADTTIPQALSDDLAGDLRDAKTPLDYELYKGATHTTVVSKGRRDALADAKKRFR